MGKGGGGSSSQTVTQTNIPSYAKPYFMELMQESIRYVQRGSDGRPKYADGVYTAYTAKRIADMPTQMTSAISAIGAIQPVNSDMTTGITANKTALTQLDPITTYTPATIAGNRNFTQAKAQDYMPGYEIEVADKAVARINKAFDEQAASRAEEAVAAGALGGTRFAVATQMASEDRNIRIAEVYATATKEGYVFAENVYARDTTRQIEIETANIKSGIEGKNLNITAITAKGQLAGQVFEKGMNSNESSVKVNEASIKASEINRQNSQQKLDQAYKDFVNQRDWHKQNLSFLAATMKSVPVSVNSDVATSESGNNIGTILGGIGTIMGQGQKG